VKRVTLFAATDSSREVPDLLEDISTIGAPPEAQPPASALVQAEQSLVGAILADNAVYDHVVETLRAEDFFDETARLIFTLAGDILEGRLQDVKVADPITLAMLPGVERVVSLEYLQALARDADTQLDLVTTRAKAVSDAATQRSLGVAAQKMQAIVADDRPVDEKTSDVQTLLASTGELKSLPVISLGNAAIKALNRLAERAQAGATGMGIETGFADLDAITAGLHGGQMIVLAARPGIGKTALALSMGLNVSRAGWEVSMASMEMMAEELSMRALAIESGVDSHAIRMGALLEQDWIDVVAAGERLQQLPFDIVDMPSVDLASLTGLCRRKRRAGKLDLLMVDYLQIMQTLNPRANREQQIAEMSRGLKKLAMMLGIPVIVLSQLNRALEQRLDRRPQLSDLRESGAIEQDADVVLFVHREDTPGKDGGQADVPAEIIVSKQRSGPTGIVETMFRKRTTQFMGRSSCAAADPLLRVAA
jgi:replicative DNA helicase